MKLKSTQAITVGIESEGRIFIQQLSEGTSKQMEIYLTLEQFNSIANWVFKNRDEIESAWNGGVSDEADS